MLLLVLSLVLLATPAVSAGKSFNEKFSHPSGSFSALHAKDIDGVDIRLGDLDGSTFLVTNSGSHHADAENYLQQLKALQSKYGKFGLEIIVFPSNQFGT